VTTLDQLFRALITQCASRETQLAAQIKLEREKIARAVSEKSIGQGTKYWERLHSLEKRRDGMQLLRAALNDVIEENKNESSS
jgi:hypothetical protein